MPNAKILVMPKRNQSYWDTLFDKFCRDIDKVVAAHYPAVSPSVRILPADECAPGPADQVSGESRDGAAVVMKRNSPDCYGDEPGIRQQPTGIQGCYGSGESTADDGGDFDA